MIENDTQYKITKEWRDLFLSTADRNQAFFEKKYKEQNSAGLLLVHAQTEQALSFVAELTWDMTAYEIKVGKST